jgi:hypothetical protein
MGVNIGPIPERDDLGDISLRIYIKDGRLDQVVPEHPWEGQVNVHVVYEDDYFELDDGICKDQDCPDQTGAWDERPSHYHDWMSVAVFRATKS